MNSKNENLRPKDENMLIKWKFSHQEKLIWTLYTQGSLSSFFYDKESYEKTNVQLSVWSLSGILTEKHENAGDIDFRAISISA